MLGLELELVGELHEDLGDQTESCGCGPGRAAGVCGRADKAGTDPAQEPERRDRIHSVVGQDHIDFASYHREDVSDQVRQVRGRLSVLMRACVCRVCRVYRVCECVVSV